MFLQVCLRIPHCKTKRLWNAESESLIAKKKRGKEPYKMKDFSTLNSFTTIFYCCERRRSVAFLFAAGENTETEGVQADEAGCVFVIVGIAVFE